MNVSAQGKHTRESPAPGWLSSFFTDNHRRRMVIAFAAALAIHEILAGLVPWRTSTIPPEQPEERITIAKLTRVVIKPTPKPIVRAHIIAPAQKQAVIINPGKSSENQHVRRVASARPLVRTRYHSGPARIHVPMGGHGAGTSKSARAETGGVGTGGTGTGEGGNGSGTGGTAGASEPCGYVDFQPNEQPTIDPNTGRVWEHITMVVHFPDHSVQNDDLDYPWYYSSRATDPFLSSTTKVATFQFPPAGYNIDPVLRYVIQHTDAQGYTKLKNCPQ